MGTVDAGVGSRVRAARKARDLTQLDLSTRVGVSESWLRGLESGRQVLAKHQVAVRLADELGVTVGWLYGQPYVPQRPDQDAGQSSVPALRRALRRTSLILSGHPDMPAEPPLPVSVLRQRIDRVIRQRQAAKLVDLCAVLPQLIEDVNTALLTETGAAFDSARKMTTEVCHVARVVLNLLGFHDLAWAATESAAQAAALLGDPLMLAESAWNRCGALLHAGDLPEAMTVAIAAMRPLEAMLAAPSGEQLAMWGALNLRCAIASGRAGNSQDAHAYLREARQTAGRLPSGFVDLTHQTVFCAAVVGIHQVELSVEIGEPGDAVTSGTRLNVAGVPSKERRTHHGIDLARAYAGVGRHAEAVVQLRQAARLSPHYVYNHPMARTVVSGLLLRGRPTARNAGLGELARRMGID